MKYPPHLARTLFIDGPVSVSVHEAPYGEIVAAYERLGKLVEVAAKVLNEAPSPLYQEWVDRQP